eukprot:TRINITY_DN3005_c0_g1_i4.p2 TRINITY_DN3005_c0_g1~~TRINITY_DN3005_c0_g1_i4.p2  ORF type:complete len:156 (-),score=25.53 TRINITY_DN3005_c0_g1_i4:16-483(-)
MVDAGTSIPSDVVEKVEEVRQQKKDFAIFKVKDGKVVHVSTFPESDEDIKAFSGDSKDREGGWKSRVYPKFFDTLKEEKEPAYVILDFRYVQEERKITKLIFVAWCPEKASVKVKMIFSATFKQFADKVNIPKRLTAHSPSDITYEELIAKAEGV